ncbi:MAG: YoaK family protein [Methanosarcina sp.]
MTSESVGLGILLAIVGGFLDAYTFVGRGGVFANAQTGNVVLMGIEAATGKWGDATLHAVPVLAFVIGVLVAELLKKPSMRLFVPDTERAVLMLEIIVLFVVGLIPYTSSNLIVTTAISFVSAVQVSSFRKLAGSTYNTTMITGNLRSAIYEIYTAITKKDPESALQAARFSTINLSFLAGAISGGLLTSFIGVRAVWAAVVVLICSVILFGMDESKDKKANSKDNNKANTKVNNKANTGA